MVSFTVTISLSTITHPGHCNVLASNIIVSNWTPLGLFVHSEHFLQMTRWRISFVWQIYSKLPIWKKKKKNHPTPKNQLPKNQDWEQWLQCNTTEFAIDTQSWCSCSKSRSHLKDHMGVDDFALSNIGPIRQIKYTTGMVQRKHFSLLKLCWMSNYQPAVQDTWTLAAKYYNMAKKTM